jgi:hypothetical protein
MKVFSAITLSLVLSLTIRAAPDPTTERTWTGKNGAHFVGTFARTFEQDGRKAQFINSQGKSVIVAFDNLSEADQEIILTFERKAPAETAKPAASHSEFFKELPAADRSKIPPLKPKDLGGTDDEALVDAIWVSLLWWEISGIMPIPKSGDVTRKAEWLHKELSRGISKGGRSSASLEDARDGVAEHFEKRMDDVGTCKATIHPTVDVETLSKLASGNTIVVLKMTMTYSNSRAFSVASALESMEADGSFVIHMFGTRFTGKMTPMPAKGHPVDRLPKPHLITLNNPDAMPDHYRTQGAAFSIGDNSWNGALSLEPLVYKTPGKKPPVEDGKARD